MLNKQWLLLLLLCWYSFPSLHKCCWDLHGQEVTEEGVASIWAGVLGMGIGGGPCPLGKSLGLDFVSVALGQKYLTKERLKA